MSTDEQVANGLGLDVQRQRIESFCASEGSCALVAARTDRLARDTLTALLIEREFTGAGVGVLYVEGATNGDAEGMRFQREILHVLASEERRRLVARLRAGREAKAQAGGYAGGRPPFGYEARGAALWPKPEEAEVVQWIFARRDPAGEPLASRPCCSPGR